MKQTIKYPYGNPVFPFSLNRSNQKCPEWRGKNKEIYKQCNLNSIVIIIIIIIIRL